MTMGQLQDTLGQMLFPLFCPLYGEIKGVRITQDNSVEVLLTIPFPKDTDAPLDKLRNDLMAKPIFGQVIMVF